MTVNELSVLEEMKAVIHLIRAMKPVKKPAIIKNAHSLISSVDVKKYLKSNYKMDQLDNFFYRYPTYFTVTDGTVCLVDPDLNEEELESVSFFQGLLFRRSNRPLHVTNAQCFLSSKDLIEYLDTKYNLCDLTQFFVHHCDIFEITKGYVELKFFISESPVGAMVQMTMVLPSKVPQEVVPIEGKESVLNKPQTKKIKKLETQAVMFFLNLIWKRKAAITTTHAHSFLGNNVDIRDHLKTQYNLSNLQAFFEAHNQEFLIKEDLIFAKVPPPSVVNPDPPKTMKKLPENPPTKVITSGAMKGVKVKILGPPPGTMTGVQVGILGPPSVTSSAPFESPLNESRPSSSASSISGVNEISSPNKKENLSFSASSKTKHIDSASDEKQKLLSHLMSLVMTTADSIPNISNSSLSTLGQTSTQSKFSDAACQTVSSGPILSLNVFHEFEKPTILKNEEVSKRQPEPKLHQS